MLSDDNLNRDLKRVGLILACMLVLAGALWALLEAWPAIGWFLNVLSPFLIALVVAYIFNPLVCFVERRLHLGRVGGVLTVALLVALILVLFLGVLAPLLYEQAGAVLVALREAAPRVVDRLSAWFGGAVDDDHRKLLLEWMSRLQVDLRDAASHIVPALSGVAGGGVEALGAASRGIGRLFSGLTGFFVSTVLVLVITFYYLLEFGAIPRLVRQALPARIEGRTMEVLGKVDVAVGGFLRGQLTVCALIAVIASVALMAIGMKQYAILVGVFAGAVNIVPYLGPAMGAAPALVWALCAYSHDTWSERLIYSALVLGVFAFIQLLDGFVFQPRIVGKSSNLHPLIVMAALLIGGTFGITGMILAVPLACIARVLFKELWWDAHLAAKASATQESQQA